MYTVSLDMFQTTALAVGVLYLGMFLRKHLTVLTKFCIPAPVVGGLIFSIVSCILYVCGLVEFEFNETLKTVCMIMFFTSVGFQANLKVLKKGGFGLILFFLSVVVLIGIQNFVALQTAAALDVDPLIGMSTGSISMVGGHGTAGAFAGKLAEKGLDSAMTLCIAAATFGLVAGSLMGGPVGQRLVKKHNLKPTEPETDENILIEEEKKHKRSARGYAPAAYQLIIAMGIGTLVSWGLSQTGMNFPVYIGSMIVAAIMRNVGELSGKFKMHMGEINDIGGISLSIFLGTAMISLKLWQLASLAVPLMVLLAVQCVLMFIYSYFVVFNVMGRDYDAAVLASGTCGFGMGATPNAMANMQAVTERFGTSVKAFLFVPIVGSMFADFINSLILNFIIESL